MRLPHVVVIAAALVAMAGCTTASPEPAAKNTPTFAPVPAVTTPTLAKCSEIFTPGKILDKERASQGCLDPDGGIVVPPSFRCNDGRHLYSMKPSSGAGGWGFGGEVYQGTQAGTDPGYSKAYQACHA